MQSLHAAFAASVAERPDSPAVLWGSESISYGRLAGASQWVARKLVDLGVRRGDRVAMWIRNRPEFIPALFGIFGAAATAVPINTFFKGPEVDYVLQNCGSRVLITEEAFRSAAEEAAAHNPGLVVVYVEEAPLSAPEGAYDGGLPTTRDELAVLIYTSGTTGRPKGVMLTHGNLLSNVESCREVLQAFDADRFVLLLPMFHSFMLTVCVLLPLIIGGSIVVARSLHPPKAVVQEILANKGSILPAMAALFRLLAGLPEGIELPLRLCISGAGPLPAEILKAFNARHPKVPLIEGYGLSEASPVVSLNPVQGPWIPGTIGVPVPNVEMTILDEKGAPLPDGVDGEVCVRGSNVMLGYWNDPAQTAEALVDGWLRTGDIGHRRPDGWYVITDRKKDMLKPNGMNVYPREIEEVIHQFPGVKECAVVGEKDARRGEVPVAFVALDEGVVWNEEALHAFLRERLADYKLPRRAEHLPALPRNAVGKILKTELRRRLAEN
jgi:long-chain acyl-CoA synthetase